jgi:hypothetical protein
MSVPEEHDSKNENITAILHKVIFVFMIFYFLSAD